MSATTSSRRTDRIAAWPAVRLVAGREIRTRITSKAFRITTAVLLIAVVALCVVVKATSGGGGTTKVAFSPQTAPLAAPYAALAGATGKKVATSTAPDRAAAERQIRDGKLDALVTGTPEHLRIVVKKDIDDTSRGTFALLARQAALDQQIKGLGGDPAAVGKAVDAAKPTVVALEKKTHYNTGRLVLGTVVAVLIFMSLQVYGQMVAQGVVEEKTSRVVELLLATLRPWQLMAGKVLGIGLIGLLQLVVIGGGGLIAAVSTGVLSISVGAAVGILVWLVVWFLIGFFTYALLLAAAGALVSRQEDVPTVTMPILMLVIVPYVLGISLLPANPGSGLVAILSIIPLFAPTLMPVRLAMGHVPIWQSGLALVLALALIPVLVQFAGRVYRNAVLRTGSRVHLKDAFRAL